MVAYPEFDASQNAGRLMSPDSLQDHPDDRLIARKHLALQARRCEDAMPKKTFPVHSWQRSKKDLLADGSRCDDIEKENWDVEDELSFG